MQNINGIRWIAVFHCQRKGFYVSVELIYTIDERPSCGNGLGRLTDEAGDHLTSNHQWR